MFSGKSEELIRRLRRAQIARQKVQIFKPLHRQPLQRRPHRLAQRHADRVGERAQLATSCSSRSTTTPRSSASTKGSSSTPNLPAVVQHAGRPRQARDRRRPRSGLPRPAVRADAAAAGDRRVHHQDAGDLRRLRRPGQPHAAAGRRAATACWSARRARTRRAAAHCFDPRLAAITAPRMVPPPIAMDRAASPALRARPGLPRCRCAALPPVHPLPAAASVGDCSPGRRRKPPFYRLLSAAGRRAERADRLQAGGAPAAPDAGVRRDDDARLLRATRCRSASRSAAASTRTASGRTAASSPIHDRRPDPGAKGRANRSPSSSSIG